MQTQFDKVDGAGRDNPFWISELLVNELESNKIEVPMIKQIRDDVER